MQRLRHHDNALSQAPHSGPVICAASPLAACHNGYRFGYWFSHWRA